jgi:hypothetical protein
LIGSGLVAALAAGCRTSHAGGDGGPEAGADGGMDGGRGDGPVPLTLTVAINGCEKYDLDTGVCSGAAPLTVSFAPVGSPALTLFKWDFGDGTPAVTARAPSHRYALPASYDVRVLGLVSEPDVGSVEFFREKAIRVDPVAIGGLCDLDAQCGSGPACTCAPGSGCAAAFRRGLCATPCPNGDCLGAVCVTLAMTTPGDGGTTRRPFCLASCEADGDCPTGLVCSTLPSGDRSHRWRRACVPRGVAIAPGGSCRDASGNLDDASCATGACADMGTLGMCSADCARTDGNDPSCPDDTICARLTDGRHLCLPACGAGDDACATDPLLACQMPATDGGAGIVADDADPTASYCAPRLCASDDQCGAGGRCGPDAVCIRT